MQLAPHPVSSTLSAEKFTEGMTPAMASVYPGKNGPAGVAGDFDKIYLPRPLVRKVHSGRPLMKGETQAKAWEPTTAESFHATIAYAPPFDATEEKPYMVPKCGRAAPRRAAPHRVRRARANLVAYRSRARAPAHTQVCA